MPDASGDYDVVLVAVRRDQLASACAGLTGLWGLSAADYVLYTLVNGIWNVFALLGLPVLALLVMATDSRPGAALITAWLVLLACLRATGLSQAQVPWQTSLAAFAFIRLLTALPITPGGLGITELGLVGTLAAGADHAVAQVTAAVLLYRAVTYLPPIPLGALACLAWRHAPALISTGPQQTAQPSDSRRPQAPAVMQSTTRT